MAYSSKYFDEIKPLDLILEAENANFTTANVTVIDEHHANAIDAYRRLGCPNAQTEAEKAEIAAAGELKSEKNAGKRFLGNASYGAEFRRAC